VDSIAFWNWLEAAIPPLMFLLILWVLLEPERPWRTAAWAAAGFSAAEAGVQGAILVLGDSPELVYTLLPLTFYVPAIVCLHLLSKKRFLPTALTWLLALLCCHLLLVLRKLLVTLNMGPAWPWVITGVLLLAAGLLLTLIFCVLRKPFQSCVEEVEGGWPSLLLLPLMLLALYSYFLSSTTNVTVLLLLLLTALSAFLVLARLIVSLAGERRERDLRAQIKALGQDYEALQKKLEMGRSYRHDMRHHMATLSALLQEGNCSEAQRYVAQWQGQLTQVEAETWCRSAAVNGVLSAYLTQAKEAGCTLDAEVSLPEDCPFEELDLGVILANALDNAIHACEAEPDGVPRRIKLNLRLIERRRLTLQVENPCHKDLKFDRDGFPIVPHREGHGQGLRSIAAVAEKYRGLFQCECKNGAFILKVVLIDAAARPRRIRRAPAVCAGAFLCLFLLNCTPALAQVLEGIPILGPVVRAADLHSYSLGWGSSGITEQDQVLEGGSEAADEIGARKEEFTRRMEAAFLWYASRRYQGYVAADITCDTVRDDEALFILRFSATLNAGGSVDYSRYVVLDKEAGQVLDLSGLFLPGSDYVSAISREVKAQMAEQISAGEADYFLPGGIWPDEECFQAIDPDQNFYINDNGKLVIVFDEYEVAPGSAGTPEFVIPADVLDGLLAQPSVIAPS